MVHNIENIVQTTIQKIKAKKWRSASSSQWYLRVRQKAGNQSNELAKVTVGNFSGGIEQ